MKRSRPVDSPFCSPRPDGQGALKINRILLLLVNLCLISMLPLARPFAPRSLLLRRRSDAYHPSSRRLRSTSPSEYMQDDPFSSYYQKPKRRRKSAFSKSLCIVPPTSLWDRIQRARHVSSDPVYHDWPPAIRLFHPFEASEFEIADAVEELDIEPFEIKLDGWTIIPHVEAMETEWKVSQGLPELQDTQNKGVSYVDPETQALIAKEEEIGRRKSKARKLKQAQLTKDEGSVEDASADVEGGNGDADDDPTAATSLNNKSPQQVFEAQQEQYEEFNGPCILCLEPDAESQELLHDLRESLVQILDHDDYFSASSAYSSNYTVLQMGYRPVMPISKLPSVSLAMELAQKLKGLWEPLTIPVTDLHIVACLDDATDLHQESIGDELAAYHPQASQYRDSAPKLDSTWGCLAQIKLMGEELEQDEDDNSDMIQRLLKEGTPGGMDISMDFTVLDDEDESTQDLLSWLNDDEEYDAGATVIIGRTHLFSGEQRIYPGMPASSTVDSKDRKSGADGGLISGAARRRSTVHRQGSLWEDGEFGHRKSDYSPWSKREKSERRRNEDKFDYDDIDDILEDMSQEGSL